MPGHVYKAAKGWRAIVDVGSDPASGKRRQRRIGPFKSRREAELAAAKAVSEAGTGPAGDTRGVTLAEYLRNEWLPAREVRGLKATTLASYRWICEAYLVPRLGQPKTIMAIAHKMLVAVFYMLRDGVPYRLRALGPSGLTAAQHEIIVSTQNIVEKLREEGRDEGRTLGRAEEGEARALLTVLRSRSISVPDSARERILAERDPVRIEQWIEKAILATSLVDVLDDPS